MTRRRGPAPQETPGPAVGAASGRGSAGGESAPPGGGESAPPGGGDSTAPGPVDPASQARPQSGRRRRGYWIPGLISLAVLTAIGVALGAGDLNHSSPKRLNGTDVAQQIALGIQAREGSHSPPDVRCPATEPVRQGWRFVCTRVAPGKAGAGAGAGPRATQSVEVTEIDGRGRVRWSLGDLGG